MISVGAGFTVFVFPSRLRPLFGAAPCLVFGLLPEMPVTIGRSEIELFVSDEVYYDWSEKAWTRNRLSAGGEKRINDRLSLEIYYTWQHNRSGSPVNEHMIGTSFKVRK